jgi:chromosome segregation ATPase
VPVEREWRVGDAVLDDWHKRWPGILPTSVPHEQVRMLIEDVRDARAALREARAQLDAARTVPMEREWRVGDDHLASLCHRDEQTIAPRWGNFNTNCGDLALDLRDARAALREAERERDEARTKVGELGGMVVDLRERLSAAEAAVAEAQQVEAEAWIARVDEARREGIEEAISVIERGRFLSDDAPPARFAREVVAAIRRELAPPSTEAK